MCVCVCVCELCIITFVFQKHYSLIIFLEYINTIVDIVLYKYQYPIYIYDIYICFYAINILNQFYVHISI